MAVANDPVKVYQANAAVLVRLGTTWARTACSMDRNGPTSFPLGLTTPIVPAMARNRKLLVQAKANPAPTMSSEPTTRTRRRPMRSAAVVRNKDTRVSPASIRVKSSPVWDSLSPRPVK